MKRSVGTKLKIGLAGFIAGLTSIGAPSKTSETLDKTTLDSDAGYREFTGGFKDGGEVAISGYLELGDGQLALDEAFESQDETDFEIIFPAEIGAGWVFRGVVTSLSLGNAELDELLGFEATIKVSGKPELVMDPSAGLSALSLTGVGGTLSPAFAAGKYSYAFSGVTATSVTVTATALNHDLKLYVDGVFMQTLTSGSASQAVTVALNTGKKLSIVVREEGKSPITYEVIVVKTA